MLVHTGDLITFTIQSTAYYDPEKYYKNNPFCSLTFQVVIYINSVSSILSFPVNKTTKEVDNLEITLVLNGVA